jgi:ribonucleotide monophosphatase NagD (HAD superfamily)
VNALKTGIGREPVILGKPHRPMWEVLKQEHNLDPARSIMIGDRLDTDIALAANCSLGYSLAVLSGVSSEQEILKLGSMLEEQNCNDVEAKCVPDFYADSLGEFEQFIRDL